MRARAGTGKTTTIIEAVRHIGNGPATETRILVCAFNKRVQVELQKRLAGTSADALTLHSLGFKFLRGAWGDLTVDSEVENERIEAACEAIDSEQPPWDVAVGVKKLVAIAKGVAPDVGRQTHAGPDSPPDPVLRLADLCSAYACDTDNDFYDPLWFGKVALRAMELALTPDVGGRISFDDMLYIPAALRFALPLYDWVIVDEAQDMNLAQLLIAQQACKSSGHIVVVGDDRQCHPPGVQIQITSNPQRTVAIESLTATATVASWNRNAQKMVGGRAIKTGVRGYVGQLIDVELSGRKLPATPNHRFICRWSDRTAGVCATYLMWRNGFGFRVGWCKLFSNGARVKMFHLAHRARIEKADRTWILKLHESRTEASAYESIVAANFGLTTITFEPVNGATHLTTETIKSIFGALTDDDAKGRQCLTAHRREFNLPLYPWPGQKMTEMQGRRTYFEAFAANLEPLHMSLPLADGQNIWAPIEAVSQRPYTGLVYSLDVELDHSYAANGVVALNSIYGFRGADSNAIDRMKAELSAEELSLTTTYRCPKKVVELAQALVPDFGHPEWADDGEVDEIEFEAVADEAQAGDVILSRVNAPLVPLCLSLIRHGKGARIEGRDIGKLLATRAKKLKASTVEDFLTKLTKWAQRSSARIIARGRAVGSRLEQIRDVEATLAALAEDAESVAMIYERCEKMFADVAQDGAAASYPNLIVLSTVHKAKGLEWKRVFMLQHTFYFYGKKPGDREEENIEYTAITRAMKHLTVVKGAHAAA